MIDPIRLNNHADADISEIPAASCDELPQILGETEPSQNTNEGNADPFTSQFTILEEHYAVSGERKIKGMLSWFLNLDCKNENGVLHISI